MALESVDDADRAGEERLAPADADVLAPFVAWMATQGLSEDTRRDHREAVEAFLLWRRAERDGSTGGDGDGRAAGLRSRFEDRLDGRERESAHAALDLFAGYRSLRARTLPVEEQH